MMGNRFPGDNHDNWIDLEEVRALFERQTESGLFSRQRAGPPFAVQSPYDGTPQTNAWQRFKARVDNFWQNGGNSAVLQPARSGFMPPSGSLPAQPK